MKKLLIKGGTAVLPEGCAPCDILLENGRIARIGTGLSAAGAKVLDASGLHIFPGLIDIDVYKRQAGVYVARGSNFRQARVPSRAPAIR